MNCIALRRPPCPRRTNDYPRAHWLGCIMACRRPAVFGRNLLQHWATTAAYTGLLGHLRHSPSVTRGRNPRPARKTARHTSARDSRSWLSRCGADRRSRRAPPKRARSSPVGVHPSTPRFNEANPGGPNSPGRCAPQSRSSGQRTGERFPSARHLRPSRPDTGTDRARVLG